MMAHLRKEKAAPSFVRAPVLDAEGEESFRMRRDNFDKPCYEKEGSSAIRGRV
jgi:hypothetical protein